MGYVDYMNFLNLYDFFVNQVAGTPLLFMALLFLFVFIISAKFRSPNIVTFSLVLVAAFFVSPFFTQALVLSILALAAFFAYSIARFLSRK